MEGLKIDVGCGPNGPRDGFIGIDRLQGGEAYPLKFNDGQPVADESVDELVASHLLEHFSYKQAYDVVKEWARVIKPGGYLKIAVPDFAWIAEHYLENDCPNIQPYTMGGHVDENDFHKALYDKSTLTNLLEGCGLVDVQKWKSDAQDCATYAVSLNLMAFKAHVIPPIKIKCAMSVPRLGFQDNFFSWSRALLPHGIVPTKYDGAYWDQCIERTMTELHESCDWILCIDYDSVFTADDVSALVRLATLHPEADAIAGMQMARGKNGSKPLLVIHNEYGGAKTQISSEAMEEPLVKLDTAHFGLTLIRCEALKKMPHPWFYSQPNKEGTWGEGRLDADIYFWHKWKQVGNTLYGANRVVIGHAELMISWPDKELNPIYQYPNDFWEKGRPEEAWE